MLSTMTHTFMTKKTVFFDTGAWFAMSDGSDQYHANAIAHVNEGNEIKTTNLVVHETFMLISRKLSRKAAIVFLSEIYSDQTVEVFHSDEALEQEAFQTIRSYPDQDFSVADCVSFALMKRKGIRRAFTFDKHFKTMRFSVEP